MKRDLRKMDFNQKSDDYLAGQAMGVAWCLEVIDSYKQKLIKVDATPDEEFIADLLERTIQALLDHAEEELGIGFPTARSGN